MLSVHGYATKKALKGTVGLHALTVLVETSMYGPEFKGPGKYPVVGPSPYERKWYATVHVDASGRITRVS